MAEQIRSLLLSVNHDEQMCNDTELLLMYAARAQHFGAGDSASTGGWQNGTL